MIQRQLLGGGVLALAVLLHLSSHAKPLSPVPAEIASSHFIVTIDGHRTPVMHAALNLYFLNFDASKHAMISVTADSDDYWAKGVEVQPWRLNIRPQRSGRTITFRLDGPAKISISRPGDYLADAEMLYLFANVPEKNPPIGDRADIRYFGPGVHHENIDAATGDSIYLAPGAIIFGSLNLWGVKDVRVFGRGVIVYDGPQNPADDDGWMHKRNWHCIAMDEATNISIEGITCVVRSRTWQIQMKNSRHILFDNIKVIGANVGNANADGMDWLGGGDTIVRNSFFRAADDIFSMETGWDGYGAEAFAAQGAPVTNITVEGSVFSTSISNIVRAGWPEKNFEGGHFLMRNSDVLHMGLGGCGIPFALMELWADPLGRGQSTDFSFENIRLEDWYSLVQLRQPSQGISGVHFKDVMGLELPSLIPSVLKGDVKEVTLDNILVAGTLAKADSDLPIGIVDGASEPSFTATGPRVRLVTSGSLHLPGQRVHFEAIPSDDADAGLTYTWMFGDGTQATGRKVSHKFADTGGTLRDGSGRFRVLLHVSTQSGRNTWLYDPVVVSDSLLPAQRVATDVPGLLYHYVESEPGSGTATEQTGTTATFDFAGIHHRPSAYSVSIEGDVDAPVDGGYSFVVIENDEMTIDLDGTRVGASPKTFAQVCGLAGNAARAVTVSVALAKGKHHLKVSETHSVGDDDFRVLWQGPQIPLGPIPAELLSHAGPVE
jgi:PKD domain